MNPLRTHPPTPLVARGRIQSGPGVAGVADLAVDEADGRDVAVLLENFAQALRTRLDLVRPLALSESMVPAAAISAASLVQIDRFLDESKQELRRSVKHFTIWLRGPGRTASPYQQQREFVRLKLEFNALLAQFDLFADVVTQRSETGTGVWLAGLDVAAADGLQAPIAGFDPPEAICYLDRGPGAAIRRARTRLPGGRENPVAIIRVPRERMVGAGIASSLTHEVGHQFSALLDLVPAVRESIERHRRSMRPADRARWQFWARWVSEILADCWAVGKVGVGATLGLTNVVSLPEAFVIRVSLDDPHPIPWIRVKLSAAFGAALYPSPQWRDLSVRWERMYPPDRWDRKRRLLFEELQRDVPAVVRLVLDHRLVAVPGQTLAGLLPTRTRQPRQLTALYERWGHDQRLWSNAPPTLAFAVLGQAKMSRLLSPEREARVTSHLLRQWALSRVIPAPRSDAVWIPTRGRLRSDKALN